MTIPLVPGPAPEVATVVNGPVNGEQLDAGVVSAAFQTLINSDAALRNLIELGWETYGRGEDGVLDLTDASAPYVLQKDSSFEKIRSLTNNCEINTNGFRLRARQLFIANGVTNTYFRSRPFVGASTQLFTAAGTYTWIVPAGMTSLTIKGGGANGGSGATFSGLHSSSHSRGGRGGGGATFTFNVAVTPGDVMTFVVGAGGKRGVSVPVGAYANPGGSGPQGGFGGHATKIYRNGTLIAGIPGGGGGGAGSGYVTPGTIPSGSSSDETYGFAGGNGGRGRMSTTTSSSGTHHGGTGASPGGYGGIGGEDPNDTASTGGVGGGGGGPPATRRDGRAGTATDPDFPFDGYGRGGATLGYRTPEGGSGGENGFDGTVSRAGGGGGSGNWLTAINAVPAAGGGGGGVGYFGSVSAIGSGNRGTGDLGGSWDSPDGADGEPGYVHLLNLSDIVVRQPGSLGVGQVGGDAVDPTPSLSTRSRYTGGRGGNGGGEGSTSPGAPGGVPKSAGPGLQIRGPVSAVTAEAGLGGCKGAGASGGVGGSGAGQNHVAIFDLYSEATSAYVHVTASGDAGNNGVAASGDGGGGGGGGGPVAFTFHQIRTLTATSFTVSVLSSGGSGGNGGAGTGSGNLGGAGGQGGESGPLWINYTGPIADGSGEGIGATILAFDEQSGRNGIGAFNARVPYLASLDFDTTPDPGLVGGSSTPWAGGIGGSGGIRRIVVSKT